MILDLLTRPPRPERSLENPKIPLSSERVFDILGGEQSAAGVRVTENTVVGLPAVYRGVRLISESVAKLPLVVFRRLAGGGKERDKNHPAYRLILRQPNDQQTAYSFWATLISNALLHGNGYAFVNRSGRGATSLVPLDPSPDVTHPVWSRSMTPEGKVTVSKHYLTSFGSSRINLREEDVLHIKGLCSDGHMGISIIKMLKDALGGAIATQQYSAVYFKNNARPNMVIEVPFAFKDEESVKRFRASWGNVHKGVDSAHKPALLEGGAKVSPFNVSNEDAQLLATRQFNLIDIANMLNLPPHKLGATNNTSYNSLEQENRAFLNDSLGGWMASIKQETQSKLLSMAEVQADSHVIEHIRDELERADRKSEAEADTFELNNGIRSLSEVRAKRNLPAGDHENMDKHRIPLNLGFVEDVDPSATVPTPTPAPVRQEDTPPQRDVVPMAAHLELLTRAITPVIRRLSLQATTATASAEKLTSWIDKVRKNGCLNDLLFVAAGSTSEEHARKIIRSYLDNLADSVELVAPSPDAIQQIMREHELDQPAALASAILKEVA